MTSLLEQLDTQLEALLRSWNIYSTIITLSLIIFILYPLFAGQEPDTHPLLLTRQANVAPVRQSGESAVYRCLETPHGYPLKTGLNVKEPGQSKWAPGKDGDIRDIWRRALSGPVTDEGQHTGQRGKILTVFGRQEVEDHDLDSLSREVNIIGQHVKQSGAGSVAIYLPNCVELLAAVFAAAFYGFHPVLIPHDQPHDTLLGLLNMSDADFLIAGAGSIGLADLKERCPKVKGAVYVVEKTSRHMDWNEQGASAWHEIVEQQAASVSHELPSNAQNEHVPDLITIWQNDTPTPGEIVAFSQQNIVSAVAAQLSALPLKQRMSASDLFLPADALTTPYILIQTFAALFSNSSVALNSVAGREVELPLATLGVSPTIIAASAQTSLKLHKETKGKATSAAKKLALRTQTQALTAGYLPPRDIFSKLNAPVTASIGTPPGKLRLLYIFERAHSGTPPLSSEELSDLRAFTGARVVYALTAAKVAGTIAQTNFYDYRLDNSTTGKHSQFGIPVSSVEVKLVDTDTHKTSDEKPQGEIVVTGPAVLDGFVNLGVHGTFRTDGTLAYL